MKLNKFILLLVLVGLAWSCKKDDDDPIPVVPPKPPAEVKTKDDANIQAFLKSHFYNYEEFNNPPENFDFKIKIDTLAGENADKTPLMDQVETKKVSVSSYSIGVDEEGSTEQILYYLEARKGIGASPSVADSSYVRYEGKLLNGTTFDGSTNIPVWFDLGIIQGPGQGARGFSEGIPNFKAGGAPIINDDGTFSVEGYGVGLIIFPSALGYYSNASGVIPPYSPLMFAIDLYAFNITDHDRDGIPSIQEDLNGNGYLWDDNTDKDDEMKVYPYTLTPNFLDRDDDGDGVLTRDEIIINTDGTITFPDSNGNGIPDYLDKTFP